jgi:hypothetical protein
MAELNYKKLQQCLYNLVEVKGVMASQVTKESGVWNIKKMIAGENEPTLSSWAKLHDAFPRDQPGTEQAEIVKNSMQNEYSTGGTRLENDKGEFRGNLNGNRYDSDSVSNPYGQYGSRYSADSINNPYGAGSKYDSESPNNPYGSGLKVFDE